MIQRTANRYSDGRYRALAAALLERCAILNLWDANQRRILSAARMWAPTHRDDSVQAPFDPANIRPLEQGDRDWCQVLKFARRSKSPRCTNRWHS